MIRVVSTTVLAVTAFTACGKNQPPPPEPSPGGSVRAIGEPMVVDGETTYVVRGTGYELRSPDRGALPLVRGEIDDAARSFARYFAEDPPTITIEITIIEGDSTGSMLASNRPRLLNGKLILPVVRDGGGGRPMPVTLTGAAVAWVWLAEYVGARRPSEAPDTVAIGPGRIGLPAWLEVAAAAVVAGSRRRLDLYLSALAMQPDELLPLATLFSATGDSLFTPIPALPSQPPPAQLRQRGGPPGQTAIYLQGIELFVAQSMAVAHYVTAREGFGSLGRLTTALVEGKTMEQFLSESRWLPKDIASLEESWRQWLGDMAGRG